jgi:hypothetical protein
MRPGYTMTPNEVTLAQAALLEFNVGMDCNTHNPKKRLQTLSCCSLYPHISNRPPFDGLRVKTWYSGRLRKSVAKIQICLKSGENFWNFIYEDQRVFHKVRSRICSAKNKWNTLLLFHGNVCIAYYFADSTNTGWFRRNLRYFGKW